MGFLILRQGMRVQFLILQRHRTEDVYSPNQTYNN